MRAFGLVLLGLGMIGGAMGYDANDWVFKEDATTASSWGGSFYGLTNGRDPDFDAPNNPDYYASNGIINIPVNDFVTPPTTPTECFAQLASNPGFTSIFNGYVSGDITNATPESCAATLNCAGRYASDNVGFYLVKLASSTCSFGYNQHGDPADNHPNANVGGSSTINGNFVIIGSLDGGGGEAVTTCADHDCVSFGFEQYTYNDNEDTTELTDNEKNDKCCTTNTVCFYPNGVAYKTGDECGCDGDCLEGKTCKSDGLCGATATDEAPVNDFSGKCSAFHTTPCGTGYTYLSSQDDVDFTGGEAGFKNTCCGKNANCKYSRSSINLSGRKGKTEVCGCDADCKGHTECKDGFCSLREGFCDVDSDCSSSGKTCSENRCITSTVVDVSPTGVVTTDLTTTTLIGAKINLQTTMKASGSSIRVSLNNLPAMTGIAQKIAARTGATELVVATVTGAGDDCNNADFDSNTGLKLVSISNGECTLRCAGTTKVSKLCRDNFGDYKYQCHDGTDWKDTEEINVGDVFTCTLDDKVYTSEVGSEIADSGVEITPVCVEAGQRVLMADGTHKNVEHLVLGDVLRTPGGTTTVRSTRRGARHLSQVHDVECAGRKGAITGNHAYHCEGEWRLPQETHKPRALTGTTDVVAVETDNYCEDRMILESGLHVETWDGRGINEWRPHSFENGRRLRCTLKGTWRDHVLQRVDSRE